MADGITIKLEGLPNLKAAIADATTDMLGAVHQANVLTAFDIDRETKRNLTELVYTRVSTSKGGPEASVFDSSRHVLTGRLRASYHVEVGDNAGNGVVWREPQPATEETKYTDDTGRTYDGSLNVEIPAGGAVIGTNVDYAPYVEFGTSRMEARPAFHMAAGEGESRHVQRLAKLVKGAVE